MRIFMRSCFAGLNAPCQRSDFENKISDKNNPEKTLEKNEQNSEFIKIIRQNPELFKIFANSFFIECSKSEFKDNEIEFVSFSNMRKEKYRINTIIKGEYVYKGAINDKALEHILNIKKNIVIYIKIVKYFQEV